MQNPKKALGYTRVSTDKQGERGLGKAAQDKAIRQACEQNGWELVGIEHDTVSGKSTNGRKAYKRALERMSGRQADILVAAKLDRLSRSVVDFGALLEQSKSERWAVNCLDLGMDTSTPVGRMVAGIVAQVAQFERERIVERTQQAMDALKTRPTLPDGRHLNARGEPKQAPGRKRQITPDQEAMIRGLHADGKSVRQIAATLTAWGRPTPSGGKWQVSTIQRVLARSEQEVAA